MRIRGEAPGECGGQSEWDERVHVGIVYDSLAKR